MPLSKPKPRKHVHTRNIICHGYHREDGFWDIEGTITDVKSYTFKSKDRNGISAGEPIHQMVVRITVDDQLVIQSIEAATDKSPYSICPEATRVYAKLKGLKIGPGWRREIKKLISIPNGCTHISDMIIGPLAVTAYQTIIPKRQEKIQKEQSIRERPFHINQCHALRSNGPIVKRDWPEFYEG